MSKFCEITGKGPLSGNNVSHSKRRTKRKFLPNLQKKRIWDQELGQWITVKLSTSALKTIDKKGLGAVLNGK